MRSRLEADEQIGFQIAPMVDVVFILMLFFMASAAMQKHEEQIVTKLPGQGNDKPPPTVFEIVIRSNGFIECGARGVNPEPCGAKESTDLPDLRAKVAGILQNSGPETPIIINPDGDAIHQRIVDVLNACLKAASDSKLGDKKSLNISFSG